MDLCKVKNVVWNLPHLGIWVSDKDLYRDDDIHLSERDNDLFLTELGKEFQAVLSSWWVQWPTLRLGSGSCRKFFQLKL